jgi:hypothetical protein
MGTYRQVINSFEAVEQFKYLYLGTTLTNQNSIYEEIKSRLKSGNACYHSVQNLFSSSLLSKSVKIKTYRTVILPVVFHGCETGLLTLREECRLRFFKKRVLRRIYGPTRNEVTGKYRGPYNKELYALYSSPNIILVIKSRRLRRAGYVARMKKSRGAYRDVVEKPEGRRTLRKPRRIWEDNIKMDLSDVGWRGIDWIDLAQDRDGWKAVVNMVIKLRVR